MREAKRLVIMALLLSMVAAAQRRRDPLTEPEADQIRDAAMEPGKRLKLYIKFAEVRLDSIEQLRSDPKAAQGRGKKIHDLLEDFTAIVDEINQNLDTYQGWQLSKDDRKLYHQALKETIEAGDKFGAKLKVLKAATETNPQTQKESSDYQFVLQDAMDALKSSEDMAHEYLNAKPEEPEKKK